MAPAAGATTHVLYDDRCNFCRWSLAHLLAWDDRGARILAPVAIQSARGQELLAAVAPAERLRTAHVIGPDGVVHSGGDMVPVLARLLPHGTPLGVVHRVVPWLVRGVYGVVATHRIRISRLVPAAAKERANADIDRRSPPDTRA